MTTYLVKGVFQDLCATEVRYTGEKVSQNRICFFDHLNTILGNRLGASRRCELLWLVEAAFP